MALQISIRKPTPKLAKDIVNGLLYLSGLWALIQPNFNIPEHTAAEINKYLLLGLGVTRFTITFFHWEEKKADTDNP